jgi:hypothetical protein
MPEAKDYFNFSERFFRSAAEIRQAVDPQGFLDFLLRQTGRNGKRFQGEPPWH